MLYIYIVIILLLLFFVYLQNRTVINPGIIFGTFWLFVFVCYVFANKVYKLNAVSELTINIIGIGIIAFLVVSLFTLKYKFNVYETVNEIKYDMELSDNKIRILLIMANIFAALLASRYFELRNQGYNASYIRSLYGSVTSYGPIRSGFEAILYSYLLRPLVYCIITILPLHLFQKKKKKKNTILMIVLLVLSSVDAGRVTYYNLIVSIIVTYFIMKKFGIEVYDFSRLKKYIPLTIIVLMYIMLQISILRGISTSVILEQFITYFAGCIPYMEDRLSIWPQSIPYTLGGAFNGGILKFVFWFTSQFNIYGGRIWDIVTEYGIKQLQVFRRIGPYTDYNAFVSAFYFFYMDFGMIGVIMGSAVWSIICSSIYKKMINHRENINIYLYILLIIGILNSMVRWPFFQSEYVFAFIYIFVVTKRVRKPVMNSQA